MSKRSNSLILALDVEPKDAEGLIRDLKDRIDIFKIGGRLFTALGPQGIDAAHECGARVFLDLKFHDIPLTVAESCRNAARLGVWGLTMHASGGFAMMKEAQEALREESKILGIQKPLVFGVTVLTSFSHSDLKSVGIPSSPANQVKRLALLAKKSGLDGVVASGDEIGIIRKACGSKFLTAVPGIRFADGNKEDDQKRTMTPEKAVELGADYLIVGRPILEAEDKIQAVEKIKKVLRS